MNELSTSTSTDIQDDHDAQPAASREKQAAESRAAATTEGPQTRGETVGHGELPPRQVAREDTWSDLPSGKANSSDVLAASGIDAAGEGDGEPSATTATHDELPPRQEGRERTWGGLLGETGNSGDLFGAAGRDAAGGHGSDPITGTEAQSELLTRPEAREHTWGDLLGGTGNGGDQHSRTGDGGQAAASDPIVGNERGTGTVPGGNDRPAGQQARDDKGGEAGVLGLHVGPSEVTSQDAAPARLGPEASGAAPDSAAETRATPSRPGDAFGRDKQGYPGALGSDANAPVGARSSAPQNADSPLPDYAGPQGHQSASAAQATADRGGQRGTRTERDADALGNGQEAAAKVTADKAAPGDGPSVDTGERTRSGAPAGPDNADVSRTADHHAEANDASGRRLGPLQPDSSEPRKAVAESKLTGSGPAETSRSDRSPAGRPEQVNFDGKNIVVTHRSADGMWFEGLPGEAPRRIGDLVLSSDDADKHRFNSLREKINSNAEDILDLGGKWTDLFRDAFGARPPTDSLPGAVPKPGPTGAHDMPEHGIDAGHTVEATLALAVVGLAAAHRLHEWWQRRDRPQREEADHASD